MKSPFLLWGFTALGLMAIDAGSLHAAAFVWDRGGAAGGSLNWASAASHDAIAALTINGGAASGHVDLAGSGMTMSGGRFGGNPGVNSSLSLSRRAALSPMARPLPLPGFGAGSYQLFNFTGSLTNNDLALEPAFLAAHPGSIIDVSTPGQVNLIVGSTPSGPETPEFPGLTYEAGGTLLRWRDLTGRTYRLEYSGALTAWQVLAGAVSANASGIIEFLDPTLRLPHRPFAV